jgi:exonuclease III
MKRQNGAIMGDSIQTLKELDNIELARTIECDCTELNNHVKIQKNDLTIISQNIRSIYCNFNDFLLNLSSFEFETDIIILTECRLSNNKLIPKLNNYISYFTKCQLNQNDGVVLYVKSSLKHKAIEVKLAQASCLQLDVLNNFIICIYRSPSNTNAESFIDSFNMHLENLTSQKSIIIAGDININIRQKEIEQSYEHNNRTSYLNMLSLHGILTGHTLPTREDNCLDHFMLRIDKTKFSAFIAILNTTTTDHFTTFLTLSKQNKNIAQNKTKITIDYDGALMHLENKSLAELLYSDDPIEIIERLLTILNNALTDNSYIKSIPNSKRILKPWVTQGMLRCIKNRNALQKKFRADKQNELLKTTYTRYRNFCNNLLKKLKRKYDRDLLSKSIKNSKLLWQNIKNITFSNKSHSQNIELINIKATPTDSAEFVNNFFVNIGKQLAEEIQCN